MKTTIILLTSILFCTALAAQTKYYNETKTFHENGYTYQCDVRGSGIVTLYNKNNQWTYTDQIDTNTGEYYVPSDGKWVPLTTDDVWTGAKRESIVNNAFSASEKQRIKGRKLTINMYIHSQTGKVVEINFEFHATNPFATIPVSVYRKIETELKNQVWYTPTTEGKKLNYICRSWRYEFQLSADSEADNNNTENGNIHNGTKITPVKELPKMPVE